MHPGNRLQVLSMTAAENFESAKSILKDGFGQPWVIINAHMEGLVKVSAVRVANVWDVYAFFTIELKHTLKLYKPKE